MKNKIAIISACFNVQPELINQHFWSIRKQENKDILHIVVDDCSTDKETRAALLVNSDLCKDHTVLISKKTNEGPGATRNSAINYILTQNDIKYICLLDMDDYLEPDSLYLRKSVLDSEPEYIAVYGDKYTARWGKNINDISYKDDELCEIEKKLESVPSFDKARLFRECYIPSCSVMFRAKPFLKYIKTFKTDIKLCEDWLIWRKLSLLGDFKKINIPIYTQTLHGNNLTTNNDVLKNHLRDMLLSKEDLNNWVSIHQDIIKL